MSIRLAAGAWPLAALLFLGPVSWAQPTDPRLYPSDASASAPLPLPTPAHAMTLPEALAFARAHQPSVRLALARVQAAEADTRITRAQWLPTLGATAQAFEATENNSTASYLGVRVVDLPRIGGTKVADHPSWSPEASTLAAIGLDQEVFDFGRIAAQSAVVDTQLVAERFASDAQRFQVELVVKDAFFGVLSAKAVLRAATDAYLRSRAHRDLAAAGVHSGLHPPIELTRAEADLTRFDVDRVRAAGAVTGAQAVLAASVGTADLVLDAAGDVGGVVPLPALDDALRSLDSRAPRVRALAAQLDAQRAVTRAVAAEMRPDLMLSGGLSSRAGGALPSSGPAAEGDGWVPNTPNWHAGLVLRWPLYDPVVHARVQSAQAREAVAAEALSVEREQERAAIQAAYARFDVAKVSLVALQRAVEASHANYAQAEARFKAGLGTAVELADAESLRTTAEIQLAIGQFDLSRARAVVSQLLAEES